MDIRREISIIGRRNHDAEQTIKRLRVEMEDWKSKSNKMQMDINELKAQYKEMESKVGAARKRNTALAGQKEDLSGKQIRLTASLNELTSENRSLTKLVENLELYFLGT
jgi:chromosome segregation ATPase